MLRPIPSRPPPVALGFVGFAILSACPAVLSTRLLVDGVAADAAQETFSTRAAFPALEPPARPSRRVPSVRAAADRTNAFAGRQTASRPG